jgi:pSer/pThr/pTyr-binding forkhead associated (FHA) protein
VKIWFNKLHDSRRSVVETTGTEITLGRDATCDVVLASPLVSRRHAVVRIQGERLELENTGLNSLLVGTAEIFGGQRISFGLGERLRIWPFTITFEKEQAPSLSRRGLLRR